MVYVTDPYTILDLCGSYSLSEDVTLRFAINNVTDINYVPAGSKYTAPGRTATASFKVKS